MDGSSIWNAEPAKPEQTSLASIDFIAPQEEKKPRKKG